MKRVLITGAPRSGTTFMGRSLSVCREFAYIHEPFNKDWGLIDFDDDFFYPDCQKRELIASAMEAMLAGKSRFKKGTTVHSVTSPKYYLKKCFSSKSFLEYYWGMQIRKKRSVLVKDPLASLAAEMMANEFGFKVIVCVRHPVAFYHSFKQLGWSFSLEPIRKQPEFVDRIGFRALPDSDVGLSESVKAGYLWLAINSALKEYAYQSGSFFVVKHEDVCLDPMGELEKVFKYLDIRIDGKVLASLERMTTSSSNVTRPHQVSRNSAEQLDKWRGKISDEEIEDIYSITGELFDQIYGRERW